MCLHSFVVSRRPQSRLVACLSLQTIPSTLLTQWSASNHSLLPSSALLVAQSLLESLPSASEFCPNRSFFRLLLALLRFLLTSLLASSLPVSFVYKSGGYLENQFEIILRFSDTV